MANMLPLLHAAGHFGYIKALHLYLQDMSNLKNMSETEYKRFTEQGFFTIRRTDKPFSGIWSDMTIEQTLNRFFGTDLKHGRGVTPSVIARYFLGMPSAFYVMEALEDYSGLLTSNSEQHSDCLASRISRDDADIQKLLFWLREHEPLKPRIELISLSTGIVANSDIDCHLALEKGRCGIQSVVGKNFGNITFSASTSKVKNFSVAQKGVQINGVNNVIDSTLLFQRIAILFQGNETKTREAFKYELSPFPPSLFDHDGFMRKSPKSELYKLFKPETESNLTFSNFTNVIDGGWLLHKIVWPHTKTFDDICNIYYVYTVKTFGSNCKVVFDGYSEESKNSIKSYERLRRKKKQLAPDVEIKKDTIVSVTQKKFLANTGNKHQFVKLLTRYFIEKGVEATVAKDDADVDIVSKALQVVTETVGAVAVVGNDVDLLVLLIASAPTDNPIFFFKVTPGSKKNVLYSTAKNQQLKSFLLFAHAFAGCDSTSAIFNQGKKSIISLIVKNSKIQESIKIFYKKNSTIEQLYPVAENIIKHLYNSKNVDLEIGEFRYKMYSDLVLSATKQTLLQSLPPTESALKMHTKRVYYQIQIWLKNENIDAEDWGWESTNAIMNPVMLENDVPLAPVSLLATVFCGCKTGCNTAKCGCVKSGLKCSQFCKGCNGHTCINADLYEMNNDNYNEQVDGEYGENEIEESFDKVDNEYRENEIKDSVDDIETQEYFDDFESRNDGDFFMDAE